MKGYQILLSSRRFEFTGYPGQPHLFLEIPIRRRVVFGTGNGEVYAVRRHQSEVYAVGKVEGKGFIARLR